MARTSDRAVPAQRRAGFTIIELLASMTILIFIVMMMTRVFGEATSIWSLGTKRISTATEGRAIMDFMVSELTQAASDNVLSFKLSSGADVTDFGVSAYGADSDEIYFGALVQAGRSGNKRNIDQFAYFIAPMLDQNENEIPFRYRLARTRRTTSMYNTPQNRADSIYAKNTWWREMKPADGFVEEADNTGQGCETIAENVAAFEVWAFSERSGYYEPDYSSTAEDNLLPLWADIYLEIFSEEDAQRMAILWDIYDKNPSPENEERALEFLSLNVKRFTARVFFPNRERANAFKP